MTKNLESIVVEPDRVRRELRAFAELLGSKVELSEKLDIQPFFARHRQLSASLGTFSADKTPATDIAFQFPFFGDFTADLVLGNKQRGEFCVVEFEDGGSHSVFKKQPKRGNPEWSARFEHGFSQLVDWFYHLDDFKGTKTFAKNFGTGHVRFTGLLVIGRNAGLDEARRNRLRWRTEKVLIDSHPINCITFDELQALLQRRFALYQSSSKLEREP